MGAMTAVDGDAALTASVSVDSSERMAAGESVLTEEDDAGGVGVVLKMALGVVTPAGVTSGDVGCEIGRGAFEDAVIVESSLYAPLAPIDAAAFPRSGCGIGDVRGESLIRINKSS